MKKVLAIRTPDGHYLEFETLRSEAGGKEIVVDLSEAIFAQVIVVPDAPEPTAAEPQSNGKRTIRIDGAGGIASEEVVKG
jgi:hypothetical protein